MGLYLGLVHLLALHMLLSYSPWPAIAAAELGLTSRWVEFDRYHQNRVGLLARHAQALAPGAALFVGDTVWDVEAAVKAGLPCIGLTCGGISAAELTDAGATAVYADPAELLEHLDDSPIGRITG
jgi:phosphoglycolate phosphatase-like HAD superfamily hydrolase